MIVSDEDYKAILEKFTNHPPKNEEVAGKMDEITSNFIGMGNFLISILPEGRERALAITNLEQCSMWAKKAIALNQ